MVKKLLEDLDLRRELAIYVTDTSVDVEGVKAKVKKHFRNLAKEYHPDKIADDPNKQKKEDFFKLFTTAETDIQKMSDDKLTTLVRGYMQNNSGDELLLAQAMTEIERLDSLVRDKDQELSTLAMAMARGGSANPHAILYNNTSLGIRITLANAPAKIDDLVRGVQEGVAAKTELTTAQRRNTDYQRQLDSNTATITGLETKLTEITTDRDRYKRLHTAGNKKREEDERKMGDLETELKTTRTAKTKAEQIQRDAVNAAEQFIKHQNEVHGKELASRQAGYDAKLKDARENPLDKKLVDKIKELRDTGRTEEALQYAHMVLSVDPDNVHVRYFVGTIYQSQGQLVQAGEQYQAILAIAPKSPSAQQQYNKVKAKMLEQVKTSRQTKDLQTTIHTCQQLLTLEPTNTDASYFLGTAYEQQKDWQKALDAYSRSGTGSSAQAGIARVKAHLSS